jgi:hypothetical protein
MVAIALRLFIGCGLTAALGASQQLPTPLAAFMAGLAAPLIIARFFQTIPVAEPSAVAASTLAAESAETPSKSVSGQVNTGDLRTTMAPESGVPDATS